MVTFNLRSSNIGKVGTLASVPHGSNAVIDMDVDTIQEMNEGFVERDKTPAEHLGELLKELGIKDDEVKLRAFQDLVESVKAAPVRSEAELQERIKESAIFGLLGKVERVLGILSSAVTIGTTIVSVLAV